MSFIVNRKLAVNLSYIPVSVFGGFGTFEAGWSVGFVLLGIQLETAVSIGLFTNVFGLLISGAMATFGYFYLMVTKRKEEYDTKEITKN